MCFCLRVLTLHFAFFWLMPLVHAQSLLSILSQKTYEFSRGDACYKDSESNATRPAANCAQCQRKGACPTTALSEVNEAIFFDQAAREYLSRTQCWEKKVESLDAGKKEALLSDLKLQLPLIVDIYNQLQDLKKKKGEYIRLYNSNGLNNQSEQMLGFNLAEKELSGQLNVILSSTWFGGHFIGKKALLDLAIQASGNPEKFISELQVKDLEQELLKPIQSKARQEQLGLLRKSQPAESLQKKVISSRTRMMTPALSVFKDGKEIKSQRRNGITQDDMDQQLLKLDPSKLTFNLNDSEKIRLFKELGLGETLLKKTPQEVKRNANLICQLNGRYGETRQAYETAISGLEFVASMALPMGPYVASAKGLISMRSAVVLSTFASAGMSVATLQRECGDSAIHYKTSPNCNSGTTSNQAFVEELSTNSCLMGAGFTAASFASPLAAKAFQKLRALKAPALKVAAKVEPAPVSTPPALPAPAKPLEKAVETPASAYAPTKTKVTFAKSSSRPVAESKVEAKAVAPAETKPAPMAETAKAADVADVKVASPKAPVVDKDHQTELWKLRESGDAKKAKAFEEKLAKKLKNQKMKDLGPVGGNNNSASRYVELEDGTKGIWKPREKTGQLEEVAAYEVDDILGMNYVPMTVPKSLDGKQGTFQLLKGNIQSAENTSHPDHLMMFDYLISNYDRHGRNYLKAEGGRVVAIDHGSAFSGLLYTKNFKQTSDLLLTKLDEAKKTGKATLSYVDDSGAKIEKTVTESELRAEAQSLYSTMTVNKSVYEKLKQTSESQWRQRLQGKLTEAQIDGLLKRRDEIIQSVERARRVYGNDILTEGPYSPLMRQTLSAPASP